ncbi:hypothetical protein MNBD_GAMMA06-132 [hydrothermal vent metagenome]|uniref:DUF4124 domain-containing protein n=1 Tax=hydrothermal vent metagenome TaxID=652676 RepID=A0A3B0WP03_9ZZZZ
MKLKILFMLIILGVLSVTPVIYMGKFDPVAFFESGLSKGSSEFSKLKAKAPENLTSAVTDKKVQIYKWRDKYGVMQFSNVPPPEVNNAEQVLLEPNKNLMQAVKVPEKKVLKEEVKTETSSPYSIKGMKKVMNDARSVEDMLKQRDVGQREMLNDI